MPRNTNFNFEVTLSNKKIVVSPKRLVEDGEEEKFVTPVKKNDKFLFADDHQFEAEEIIEKEEFFFQEMNMILNEKVGPSPIQSMQFRDSASKTYLMRSPLDKNKDHKALANSMTEVMLLRYKTLSGDEQARSFN